ncbi:hypothetical protein OLP40_01190 [Campylobacter jejuni]|nr:hypothetical protein [Campylobacter jejuni]MCW1358529.1 hypothetical protein [Campylobacter jejuni]HDZ4937845.1 hypothetical protein [Campylobacter jejuni]HDZ4952622.1 hypothetical protein [Campylobacter jejuni]HDZ4999634.1 hypothetical protein [Campylobacter jejuni]
MTASGITFKTEALDLSCVTDNGFYIMSATKGFENGLDSNKSFTNMSSNNKGALLFHN